MLKRIFISIFISISLLLAILSLISYLRVQDSIKKSYEERLAAAEMIASTIDHVLENNLARLYDMSLSGRIDFEDDDWRPEQAALRGAYEYSIFRDGILLLDRQGNVVQRHPQRHAGMVNILNIPAVSKAVTEIRPVVSNLYTIEPIRKKVLFAIVPLKNRNGEVVGSAVGEIDPANHQLAQTMTYMPLKTKISVQLVDNQGALIASNHQAGETTPADHNKFFASHIAGKKRYIGICHRCHEGEKTFDRKNKDILVLAPLANAPWAVVMKEPEKSVLTTSALLKKDFIVIAVTALATAFLLALGMSKRVVKPVKALIAAAESLGKGNLGDPVEVKGDDEIGVLARSFDAMRVKLAQSVDSIQQYNAELERRVRERTRELEGKRAAIQTLLKKIISSQEEERKRIAREMHDETLQALSAILMDVGVCKLRPDLMTPGKVSTMYESITKIINEMNSLVQNLRPTVLDDLGFGPSIVWVLERNLKDRGINYYLNMNGSTGRRFSPEFEITLFRIIQEASANIARHARAESVFVQLGRKNGILLVTIEDDGRGFDTGTLFHDNLKRRGLGILGMKERAALLDGRLTVCSSPEAGTMVSLEIPVQEVR